MSELPGGGDSVLRKRKIRPVEDLKYLDAFPKVSDDVKEPTASGGGISLMAFIIIVVLVLLEFRTYISTEMQYTYSVDTEYNRKIRLNIDITVAAKCEAIGADIVDVTESSTIAGEDQIVEEPVSFVMTKSEKVEWEIVSQMAEYVRREHHALHDIFWREGFNQKKATEHFRNLYDQEKGNDEEVQKSEGCRIHGFFRLNKISGNLHIIAGKSMNLFPFGHAHMQLVMPVAGGGILIGGAPAAVNFSHRISHLSFGTPVAGMVHPLDGDQKIAAKENVMYQYHLKVIPTEVDTVHASDKQTFQMAVTENERTIDHSEGSHGIAGIFFKYEFSPLAVKIHQYHKPYWQFIVRLCGIIGGVFATTGFLHFVVGFFVDSFMCRWENLRAPSRSTASMLEGTSPILEGTSKPNGHAN